MSCFRKQRHRSRVEVPRISPKVVLIGALLLNPLLSAVSSATETRHFRQHSKAGFLQGTLEGIAIDSLGTLRLADEATRLAEIDEPFLLSASSHPRGWVVGTGNAGRVLLVTFDGEVEELFVADEPEIFAVWAAADGTVYAGSSPDGKVYRLREGEEAAVHFDPEETYIWSLGQTPGGDLLVATGTRGRLFEVDAAGNGTVLYDSEDTHLRSMKVLDDGTILIGTAGEGLILKLTPDGSPRTLFDAPHPEVVAFASAPDGSCYAALLASEASLVSLSRRPTEDPEEESGSGATGDGGSDEPRVEVVVSTGEDAAGAAVGSRPQGFGGARSEVVRISAEGVVETVTSFQEETVYSLIWQRGRLWIGTGLEGKVYSVTDHRPVLEKDVDERQVVALLPDSPGPAFATTNAATLYRISGRTERAGSYTSAALDAEQISRFGNLRWLGEQPRGTTIEFSFRSGMSAEPDRTWTAWTTPVAGEEIPLGELASGRFVQWRADLQAADGRSPSLSEVTLSYRQANLPPRITSLTVLDPGEILVPANFNPGQQVYEPASPNRQGIFTTIAPTTTPDQQRRLKTLWRRGFRTLRWEAEDPNGDALTYKLSFRPVLADVDWLTVSDELEESYFSFDTTVLPDGRYRFRLEAFDRTRSEDNERKAADEISEPVLVDHSNPGIVEINRHDGRLTIVAEDRWNPLRAAEYSLDAMEWLPVKAADGLLDGRRETLVLDAPEEGRLLLLRLTDAAFNVITIDLSQGAGP